MSTCIEPQSQVCATLRFAFTFKYICISRHAKTVRGATLAIIGARGGVGDFANALRESRSNASALRLPIPRKSPSEHVARVSFPRSPCCPEAGRGAENECARQSPEWTESSGLPGAGPRQKQKSGPQRPSYGEQIWRVSRETLICTLPRRRNLEVDFLFFVTP